MVRVSVFLAACVGGALAAPPKGHEVTLDYEYDQFLADFHKAVVPKERERRERKFRENLAKIVAHNSKRDKGYVMGVNRFTDEDPPKGLHRGVRATRLAAPRLAAREVDVSALPAAVDWRDKGVVTGVKDQGGCGSCWAFASTAVMESHVAIATGTLFQLAPQELVSCMPNPLECGGTGGCAGATSELAFQYYVDNGGVVQEFQMGYTSYYGKNGDCYIKNATASKDAGPDPGGITHPVATITGFTKLPVNDHAALMHAVATYGPIAVSVDASWSGYESGIFESDNFNATIDHAVTLVGYGSEDGKDYWLVRNSWGPVWGEGGYIRLLRHDGSAQYCGVDTSPLDGVGCKGGPATMATCGTSGILSDSAYPVGGKLV